MKCTCQLAGVFLDCKYPYSPLLRLAYLLIVSSNQTKIKIPTWGFKLWWPWSDSNRHSLQNLILSQARLPIPPRGQNTEKTELGGFLCFYFLYQACAAVCLVCRLFCRGSWFACFLFNGFFDCGHIFC